MIVQWTIQEGVYTRDQMGEYYRRNGKTTVHQGLVVGFVTVHETVVHAIIVDDDNDLTSLPLSELKVIEK
jgi:hypothetical protein